MELPDTYETRTGRDLAAALDFADVTGDYGRVDQLVAHAVAEAGITPDMARANVLYGLAIRAGKRGDEARASELMRRLVDECGRDAADMLVAVSHLKVGAEQGWLPAADHDRLTAYLARNDEGGDVADHFRKLAEGIRRVE